jgi:glycosyltransferase involved in cell wall biosynthesis
MKNRILLIGDVVGSYRSQNLVKMLLDQGWYVSLTPRAYYGFLGRPSPQPLPFRVLRGVCRPLAALLFVGEVLVKAAFADVLWLMAMNHNHALLAYFAKLLSRKPLITDLYTSAYDTGRDRDWYPNPKALKAKYHKLLDRIRLEGSDIIIHLARVELEYIAGLVGAKVKSECVRIVPLAVERRTTATPTPSEVFRICWWGTFIPLHGLEKILRAVKLLIDRGVEVRCDLFGGAENPETPLGHPDHPGTRYSKMVSELDLAPYVAIYTDKSFANGQLEAHLQTKCDLALGIFGDSEKASKVIANKIVDAFAMGLPVLTMDCAALSEFIDADTELFTCPNSPGEIARAIEQIIAQPQERKQRALAGQSRYRMTFTVDAFATRVQDAIAAALRSPATESTRTGQSGLSNSGRQAGAKAEARCGDRGGTFRHDDVQAAGVVAPNGEPK